MFCMVYSGETSSEDFPHKIGGEGFLRFEQMGKVDAGYLTRDRDGTGTAAPSVPGLVPV